MKNFVKNSLGLMLVFMCVEHINSQTLKTTVNANLGDSQIITANKLRTTFNVVSDSVSSKENTATVNSKLAVKVNNSLFADTTTGLRNSISTKASIVALNLKVDKITGKQLSTNDYTTAEQVKLSGIAVGATANSTDVNLRDRTTHTGVQPISTITGLETMLNPITLKMDSTRVNNLLGFKANTVTGKQLSTEDYSTSEKAKLATVATGATANSTDANLRDRTTHTGSQAISTVSGLQTVLDSKLTLIISTSFSAIPVQSGANYKLILVLVDETNNNIPTLYLYDGVGLQSLISTKIY